MIVLSLEVAFARRGSLYCPEKSSKSIGYSELELLGFEVPFDRLEGGSLLTLSPMSLVL